MRLAAVLTTAGGAWPTGGFNAEPGHPYAVVYPGYLSGWRWDEATLIMVGRTRVPVPDGETWYQANGCAAAVQQAPGVPHRLLFLRDPALRIKLRHHTDARLARVMERHRLHRGCDRPLALDSMETADGCLADHHCRRVGDDARLYGLARERLSAAATRRGDPMRLACFLTGLMVIGFSLRRLLFPESMVTWAALYIFSAGIAFYIIALARAYGRGPHF
ncbi:MAG TPA: hypothetical protein VF637_14160 [Sphingomicrobium sp.]